MWLWIVLAVIIVLGFSYLIYNIILNRTFTVTRCEVSSEKLENDFVGVLLTDLHCQEYGTDNEDLIAAIKEEQPDVIFCAGDMLNSNTEDFSSTINVLTKLGEIAPVYYAFGNHEYKLMLAGKFTAKKDIKAIPNVHLIEYGSEIEEVNGNRIKIGGFSIAQESWERYGKHWFELFEDERYFFILLSHYPWTVPDNFPETSIDVVLSGHAHGGQVHLWDDVGLIAPGKGFFAPLTSGIHDIQGTTEIISRGLGQHTWIPRINNQPELVVINFKAE